MELDFFIGKKAQASVEFLLIIVIILIYLHAYIHPAVINTTSAIEDTKRVGMLKVAVQKLANGVNEIAALSGEGKKTIHLILPAESTIEGNSKITGSVPLKSLPKADATAWDNCLAKAIETECTADIGCGWSIDNEKCLPKGESLPKGCDISAIRDKISCRTESELLEDVQMPALENPEDEKTIKQTVEIKKQAGAMYVTPQP